MGRGAHTKGMITLSRFRYLGSHCLGERGRHLALDVGIWRTVVSTGECIWKRPVSMAGYIFSEGFFFFGGVPVRVGCDATTGPATILPGIPVTGADSM